MPESPELQKFYETCSLGDPGRYKERVNLGTPQPWFCGLLICPHEGIEMSGLNCLRAPGHSGRHVAEGGGFVTGIQDE